METLLPSVVVQLSVTCIIGFLAGFALKKWVRLLVLLVGSFILFLIFCQYIAVITVDYVAIEALFRELLEYFSKLDLLHAAVNSATVVGFSAGFFIGFRKG